MAISRGLAQGVRSGNLFSKREATVLDTPEQDRAYAPNDPTEGRRRAAVTEMPLRHNSSNPYDADHDPDDSDPDFDDDFSGRARRPGLRLSFHGGLIPKSLWGRIAASCALLGLLAVAVAAGFAVRSFLLHDEHFVIASSDSIQIVGNSHLTRPQLLSIFGEDVERSIFNVPLAQRRTQLESLPWVEHATVMRLLPNHIRIAIVERTPIAFVRQGSEIGLVDANGVLLSLPGPDVPAVDLSGTDASGADQPSVTAVATPHYSFPVLTGVSATDPLSTRAARIKIYTAFIAALDASGEDISHRLSEVDITYPEDVKAIISDPGTSESGSGKSDVLVHFGDGKFLERYHQYEQHLAEWRAQYPHLASVDLRYERQVVLEMQPNQAQAATIATNAEAAAHAAASAATAGAPSVVPTATASKGKPTAPIHPAATKLKPAPLKVKPAPVAKPVAKLAGPPAASTAHATTKMLATGKVAPHPTAVAPQGVAR